MAERMRQDGRFAGHGWRGWRLRIAIVLLGGLAVVGIFQGISGRREKSVEQRLAAIYAAHVLGPEENAATIYYNRLLVAYLPERLRVPAPDLPVDSNDVSPLQFSDEERMRVFLEAATRPKCFFPALCDSAGPVAAMRWMRSTTFERTSVMRLLAWSILAAALDDLDQGRLDAAKQKLHCVAQTAAHLRQQPTYVDFLIAHAIEDYLWSAVGEFIVQRDATNEHLAVIEGILPSFVDAWEEESADVRQVEILLDTRSPWRRLRDMLDGGGPRHAIETCALNYHEIICERRGVRILIELRRHKNETGRWPDAISDVTARLPAGVLADPLRPGELVYKPDGDGFFLYSTGPNGRKEAAGDDYGIWPRRGIWEWLKEKQFKDLEAVMLRKS